jgi:hypothetical protein
LNWPPATTRRWRRRFSSCPSCCARRWTCAPGARCSTSRPAAATPRSPPPGLDEARQKDYAAEQLELLKRFNRSGDETLVLPGEYLEAVIDRK